MDMSRAEKCAEFVKKITGDFVPEIGIILGSGMGGIFNGADIKYIVDYADIPGFPKATVEGHQGRFLFVEYKGKNIVVMQGNDAACRHDTQQLDIGASLFPKAFFPFHRPSPCLTLPLSSRSRA